MNLARALYEEFSIGGEPWEQLPVAVHAHWSRVANKARALVQREVVEELLALQRAMAARAESGETSLRELRLVK